MHRNLAWREQQREAWGPCPAGPARSCLLRILAGSPFLRWTTSVGFLEGNLPRAPAVALQGLEKVLGCRAGCTPGSQGWAEDKGGSQRGGVLQAERGVRPGIDPGPARPLPLTCLGTPWFPTCQVFLEFCLSETVTLRRRVLCCANPPGGARRGQWPGRGHG